VKTILANAPFEQLNAGRAPSRIDACKDREAAGVAVSDLPMLDERLGDHHA
jgi:hypothetical protein